MGIRVEWKGKGKGTTRRGSCDPATVDRGRENCFRQVRAGRLEGRGATRRALLGQRLQDLSQYIGRLGALQMRILDPAVVGNRIGLEEVCILHQEINRLVATV